MSPTNAAAQPCSTDPETDRGPCYPATASKFDNRCEEEQRNIPAGQISAKIRLRTPGVTTSIAEEIVCSSVRNTYDDPNYHRLGSDPRPPTTIAAKLIGAKFGQLTEWIGVNSAERTVVRNSRVRSEFSFDEGIPRPVPLWR